MYEILRLRATDMSDEQKAKEYCSEVKKRLFGPYRVSFSINPACFAFHDRANDSAMSNFSHVDVKQQSCVQSRCITEAVIERSRIIERRTSLELLIMLPFFF